VFLDDLEYLTPINDEPPHLIRIANNCSPPITAKELDFLQLELFELELITHL